MAVRFLKCILTENECYKVNRQIQVKGVMVHSTGANNPNLKRYVQPVDYTPDKDELLRLLGKNSYGNHWNQLRPGGTQVCVHGFIGKLADGSIATVQTLPWNWLGWHAGTGTVRGGNTTHISFEICEDGLTDSTYFNKVYKEAVELVAMLCDEYDLNPLEDGVVICHSEGYKRGIASNHADVMHWFPKFGRTMDTFRVDVANTLAKLHADKKDNEEEKEKEDNTVIEEKPVDKTKIKVDVALYKNLEYRRRYIVNNESGIDFCSGANKTVIEKIKNGATVCCYGYYNKAGNDIWLYVTYNGMAGYVNKAHLVEGKPY